MPIPSTPNILENVLGYNADVNSIPSVTEDGSGSFSYQSGFPAITQVPISSGGIAPARKDFNAVIKLISQHLFWLQSGGLYTWNSSLNYQPGAHVLGSDGVEYICQAVNGPDYTGVGYKDPTTDDGTYWKKAAMSYWNIISNSNEYNDSISSLLDADALETFRKSMIGTPRYWRSTSLPANHCWANGDLVYFEDWPELKEVYEEGGFSGMLMAYNASTSTQSSNLGKWRPNASSPTGLYTPNLTSQFLRGTAASGGTTNSAGLPNITGGGSTDTSYLYSFIMYSTSLGSGAWSNTLKKVYVPEVNSKTTDVVGSYSFNASNSNSIYGSSSTVMPASVNMPIVIYLGKSA